MKQLLIILFISAVCSFDLLAQNQNNMENQIKEVILNIERGASQRDVKQISEHLHDDYRVVANRFRGSSTATVISKEAYLTMIKDGKIGGTSYEIIFEDIKVSGHTAIVDLTYVSKTTSNIHKYLVLVQDENDLWKVVSDIPLVIDN